MKVVFFGLGVIFFLCLVQTIHAGRVSNVHPDTGITLGPDLVRSKNPKRFWFVVVVLVILSVSSIIGVFFVK